MQRTGKHWFSWLVICVVGAIIGGGLAELLKGLPQLSAVSETLTRTHLLFVMPPTTVDLYLIKIVCGLELKPTLASMLGLLVAALLYRWR